MEELMNEGEWPGVVDRWLVRQRGGVVILPWHLDRLMGVCVDGRPRELRSGWFEFAQYGPGTQGGVEEGGVGKAWVDVVLERGETCLQVELPATKGPWFLRVDGSGDDAGKVVHLYGTDESVKRVSCDVSVGGAASDAAFAYVMAVVKPVTAGYVRLFGVDVKSGEEVLLAEYGAGETCPSYRRYFVPAMERAAGANVNGDGECVVLARCRRRFVPLSGDEREVLLISNLPALVAMMQGQWKREAGNWEDYQGYKNVAVELMAKEAAAYRGRARVPGLEFARGFPIGVGCGLGVVR